MKKDLWQKENSKKHRFVVGYVGAGQVIYNMREKERLNHIEPSTFLQAKRALKELHPTSRQRIAIYELKLVDVY